MTRLLLVMQLHMSQHVGERGTADATGSKILGRKDGMLLAALLEGDERRRCSTYWTCCCCYWSICSITMIKECVSTSTAATSLFCFFYASFFYYFLVNERKSIRSLNRFTLWAQREGAGMGGKDSYAEMHQHSPWVCNKLTIHLKIKSWPPVNKASYSKFQHKQTLIEQVWSSG